MLADAPSEDSINAPVEQLPIRSIQLDDGNKSTPGAVQESQNWAWDYTGRLMLINLEANQSNSSSDYAYVQALNPLSSVNNDLPYTYPYNLPRGLVFIDCTGWLPADECMRYLMMGYRVWNEEGRRMHIAGTAVGYDGLKAPIRYATKAVCLQPTDQIPDLYSQIQTGDLYQDPPTEDARKTGMPWNSKRSAPSFRKENAGLFEMAQILWMESRFEHSQVCYTLPLRDSCKCYGGCRLTASPLKHFRPEDYVSCGASPYPQIGVDLNCLTIRYPPFKATITSDDENPMLLKDKLCSICVSLDFKDIFEWGLEDLDIDFGSTEKLISRKSCPFCRLLAGLCSDGLEFLQRIRGATVNCSSRSMEPDFRKNLPIVATLVRNPVLCLSTKPHLVLSQSYHREYLGPIISCRTTNGDLVGNVSISVARSLNYTRLRKMIRQCDTKHGNQCKQHNYVNSRILGEQQSSLPLTLLLDVKQMCLVRTDLRSVRYAALSYVWGGTTMLQTTKTNLDAFCEPGALSDIGLSRLLLDTIEVVKGLRLDYLWVDALCIVQDDLDNKQRQIEMMAQIYGSAYITLAALSGTSTDSPLPGVSEPLPQLVEIVDDMLFTTRLSPLAWNAHNRVYEQRGWTFQERLVSRRCLFFTERQVYFGCNEMTTSDREQSFPTNDRGRLDFPFNPFKELSKTIKKKDPKPADRSEVFSLACLDFFCHLVSQYTSRQLTHKSDVENAFLGVQTAVQNHLQWTFIGGLPINVFDWALLWLPHGEIRRRTWQDRTSDKEEGFEQITYQRPPSWSWFGWDGQISYACYTYHGKPFLQNIRPRISSYCFKNGTTKINIDRHPSFIWHEDVRNDVEEAYKAHRMVDNDDIIGDRSTSQTASLPWLMNPNCVLEFEAETTPALFNRFHKSNDDHLEPGGFGDIKAFLLWEGSHSRSRSRSRSRLDRKDDVGVRGRSLIWTHAAYSGIARSLSRSLLSNRYLSRDRGRYRSDSRSSHSNDKSRWSCTADSQRERSYSEPRFLGNLFKIGSREWFTGSMRQWRRRLSRRNSAESSISSHSYGLFGGIFPSSRKKRQDLDTTLDISKDGGINAIIDSNIRPSDTDKPVRNPNNPFGFSFLDGPGLNADPTIATPLASIETYCERPEPSLSPPVSVHSRSRSTDSSSSSIPSPRNPTHPLTFAIGIEWMTTGPAYEMVHHGLRHRNFNDRILNLARSYVDSSPSRQLQLVAMVDADVMQTFRGGQHGEEKEFVQSGKVIVMLIVEAEASDYHGYGEAEETTTWERVAIGFADKEQWDVLRRDGAVVKKVVRMV